METINLAGITYDSIVDGPGLRTTIFTQGCPHACLGCHNPETWSFENKEIRKVDDVITLLLASSNKSVTFSGGEPFSQASACHQIATNLKDHGFNLWAYSGYTFEELLKGSSEQIDFLKQLDVLVDGKFILEQRSLSLLYKGSKNQRVIDVQKSLSSHTIVLYQLEKVSKESSVKLFI